MKYNRNNNYNRNNYGNRNDQVGPYVPPTNREYSSSKSCGNMSCIEDMTQMIIGRFDSTDENVKEMWNDIVWYCSKI